MKLKSFSLLFSAILLISLILPQNANAQQCIAICRSDPADAQTNCQNVGLTYCGQIIVDPNFCGAPGYEGYLCCPTLNCPVPQPCAVENQQCFPAGGFDCCSPSNYQCAASSGGSYCQFNPIIPTATNTPPPSVPTNTPAPGITSRPQLDPKCGPASINTAIGCIPVGDSNAFIGFILRWAIGIAGGIALILIVAAGFQIITSAGNPQKVQAGRELLTAALTGLLLLIFSVFILDLIGVRILKIPGL